jgi:hypothetical protein
MNGEIENGASIIQAGDFLDPTAIPATISLPAAVWERLTADLRDDDREGLNRLELPDTPLAARIALFLEMQMIGWEGPAEQTELAVDHAFTDDDLNDGVPF